MIRLARCPGGPVTLYIDSPVLLYTDSIASLTTRREVRGFLARALDGLIGGGVQQDLPDELSDLATGSDREVIESSRRLDKCYETRGAAHAARPGIAMGQQIRDLFATALQRMKELPPDPRETLHAPLPAPTERRPAPPEATSAIDRARHAIARRCCPGSSRGVPTRALCGGGEFVDRRQAPWAVRAQSAHECSRLSPPGLLLRGPMRLEFRSAGGLTRTA